MTNEEILKAFHLCNTDTDCDNSDCPYKDMISGCIPALNNDITSRFTELKAENAALRERLGKAIILPCKLGDKLYFVNKYLATPKIQEHYITAIEIFPSYVKLYVEDGGYFILNGDNVYFNPEAAEARLKELKGEKE